MQSKQSFPAKLDHGLTERAAQGLARFRRKGRVFATTVSSETSNKNSPPTDQKLCVMVVEDSPTFTQQIGAALAMLGQHTVVSFANGKDALDFLQGNEGSTIGLALVDIGLPDINGIEIVRQVRGRLPDVPILVISVIKAELTLLQAIRAGANGYIVKDESQEAIAHAIDDVLAGNYPISPSLARTLFQLAGSPLDRTDQEPEDDDGKFRLSPREVQVLHLIARGLTYSEVAAELAVSLSTIQTYVRGLYRKLGVHNRTSAVNKGRAGGLIRGQF